MLLNFLFIELNDNINHIIASMIIAIIIKVQALTITGAITNCCVLHDSARYYFYINKYKNQLLKIEK